MKYKFSRSANDWYIDLPEFIEKGGSQGDLQMVEGADKMLDFIAGIEDTVELLLSTTPIENSDILIQKEICDPLKGGAIYFLAEFEGKNLNQSLWLCNVTEFVFGNLPKMIFIKRV